MNKSTIVQEKSNIISSWFSQNNSTDIHCPPYFQVTRPYPDDLIERLSLWPGLMTDFDKKYGETAYGSQYALDIIFNHQNPENCSTAKYLVSGGWPYGFGSRIHTEGIGLAIAMQLGRIYLYHPDGDNIFWETDNPFCKGRPEIGFDCYYEPISKCTIQDALSSSTETVNDFPNYYLDDFNEIFELDGHQPFVNSIANIKSINLIYTLPRPHSHNTKNFMKNETIPFILQPILDCSPMRKDAYYYWWRALSAAYLIRPNLLTINTLSKMAPFQLSDTDTRSCIAMHVRHGDKEIEMKLVGFEAYANTATTMWNAGLIPGSKHFQLPSTINSHHTKHYDIHPPRFSEEVLAIPDQNGTFFISTEDVKVLEVSDQYGHTNGWQIRYTNLFDRSVQTAAKSWADQHKKGSAAVHDNLEYLSMILNLQFALQCEGWVCTLASNTCRVIDEMRATVGAKANRHFADLSVETCPNQPCIDTGIAYFGE